MDQLTLSFLGVMLGTIGATIYPFAWKIMENPELAFDKKYAITMLMSILLTITTSPMVFLTVQIPTTAEGTMFLLATSFAIGFTANSIVNRPVSFFANKVVKVKPAEVKPSEPSK